MTTPPEFQFILADDEGRHLEFKEAKNRFDFEELVRYCAALANEGGGKIILGVTDQKPRRVVGTSAFTPPQRTEQGLVDRLHLKILAEEYPDPQGRVLIFHVPGRPLGVPIQYVGAYWMRSGEGLAPMTPDMLQRIFAEAVPDFSAEPCLRATLADLDPAAIENFRARWLKKSGQAALAQLPAEQLLRDAELLVDGRLNYAALVLLGTRAALGKFLGQAEVVFEYRSSEAPGPAQDRREFRQGFLPVLDTLWDAIHLRNDLQHFQDGLSIWDVPTFNEVAVRETVLNAVSHRDYRLAGSVFARQFPRRIEIVSPGGFPSGITPANVLWQQSPRNRRIAEVLGKCGLVERAGQGFDRIYKECIRQSKRVPDFTHTDAHSVWVTLHGEIQDENFLRFLEKVGPQRLDQFTTEDFLVLDLLHREQPVPAALRPRLPGLVDLGFIEPAGRGRHILSRSLYAHLGKKGTYTRLRGLDRETNKELLLRHIRENAETGSTLDELTQVLPALTLHQVRRLLKDLKEEGRVEPKGIRRWARWFPPPDLKASQTTSNKHGLWHGL